MGNSAKIVVLAEDRQQQNFVYHWLLRRGFGSRDIRLEPVPAGSQAGEQYVRVQYPSQAKAIRQGAHHVERRLVTVIDADTQPVEHRYRQLDEALTGAKQAPRSDSDRICILVPKRNVETWIHQLVTGPVDESSDYKPKTSEDCKSAARRLADTPESADAGNAPPSLTRGRDELEKTFPRK
jgi:hypothetical protein